MNIVYATRTFVTGVGGMTKVEAGTCWPADDPIVKAFPDGFSRNPLDSPAFRCTVRPIEAATANPGEKRDTRRG